jgi:ribosomal protein S15
MLGNCSVVLVTLGFLLLQYNHAFSTLQLKNKMNFVPLMCTPKSFIKKDSSNINKNNPSNAFKFRPRITQPQFEVPLDYLARMIEEDETKEKFRIPGKAELNNAIVTLAGNQWQRHENDVGSSEVQIARCNARIKYLTDHLLRNKHDYAAKRGMYAIVALRKRCTDYLYKHDKEKALAIVSALDYRYRPPGKCWDRAIKYSHFKNTKSKLHKVGKKQA